MQNASLSRAEKIIVALAAVGVVVMGYLIYVHYEKTGSTLCDLAPGFSCEVVNKSIYAEIFGVPVSVLGLAYFFSVIMLVAGRIRHGAKAIELFTLGALVFSLYLTVVEVYLLGTICLFCEFSKVLMLTILGVTHRASRRSGTPVPVKFHAAALVAGGVGTVVLHFIQR